MHRSVRHTTSKESASVFAFHSQNLELALLRAFSHFLSRPLQDLIVFTRDERLGKVLTIKILLRLQIPCETIWKCDWLVDGRKTDWQARFSMLVSYAHLEVTLVRIERFVQRLSRYGVIVSAYTLLKARELKLFDVSGPHAGAYAELVLRLLHACS